MNQRTTSLQEREFYVLKAIKQGANYKYKIYINTPMTRLNTIQATNSLLQKNLIKSDPAPFRSHYRETFSVTEDGYKYLKLLESVMELVVK